VGNLYDLLGQRENAIAAYRKALECPDWWDSQDGSTHERVRRYLKQPFGEKELYDLMRRRLAK
ncbi:MAG: tetratricopeptide repeat protein, partial [Armatimonadota bacterium]